MVEGVQGGLQKSILELRRLMVELHPPALRERGLDAALTDYLAGMQRAGIECHLESVLGARLHADIEITLYRIIQEALTNAYQHGGASNAEVDFRATANMIVCTVRDDGRGIAWLDGSSPIGMGILGMKERAAALGGVLTIRNRPRGGTAVTASF